MKPDTIHKTLSAVLENITQLYMDEKINEQEYDRLMVDHEEVVSLLRIAYRRVLRLQAEVIYLEDKNE
jgi:hypothetical protein